MPTDTSEVTPTESPKVQVMAQGMAVDTYTESLKAEAIKHRQKAKDRKSKLEAVTKEKAELEKRLGELTKSQATISETLTKAKANVKGVKIDSILAEAGVKDPDLANVIKAGLDSQIKVSDSLELEFEADKITTLVNKLKNVQGSSATPNPANTAQTAAKEVISNAAITAVTQHSNTNQPGKPTVNILTETAQDRLNSALIAALQAAKT